MKKYLLTTFAVLVMAAFACAQDITKARSDFNLGLYSQAAEEFEPLLNSKDNTTRWEAQLKTALSYIYLYQYDNAVKALFSFPAPKDKLWLARYYYLKAASLGYNGLVYRSPDLQESESDPTKFTYEQKEAEAKKIYSDLWNMRKDLVDFPTSKSNDYIKMNYAYIDNITMPSLFDFFVKSWTRHGIQTEAKILEEAYSLDGKDRSIAKELWHIKRLTLFKKNDDASANIPLAECLDYVAGQTESCKEYKEIKPYLFTAKEVLGKASASIESANIYLAAKEYEKASSAVNYCLSLPLNYFSQSCKSIKNALEAPLLTFSSEYAPFNTAAGEDVELEITSANIKNFYMHIFPLSYTDFSQKCYRKQQGGQCWDTTPNRGNEILKNLKPSRTLAVEVKYPQKYAPLTTSVTVPYISDGFYAVGLSKNKRYNADDPVLYLNFTDLAAFATSFTTISREKIKTPFYKDYFNIYTIDAKTGALRPNIKIMSGLGNYKTGINAQALIPLNYNQISLLAQDFGNNAIISSFYSGRAERPAFQIITNTDRAIYRPGQILKVAFNVIENSPANPVPYSGKEKLALNIYNHGKMLTQTTLSLDDMGSAEYTFDIPKDLLLGSLELRTKFKDVDSYHSVKVEEYKRPEFEVALDKNTKTVTYDKPFTISGNANYYYGNAVANAEVKYSITKEYFIPWFCWYFPGRQSRQQNIEGKTVTDKNGNFKIVFTPTEDENNKDSQYSLPQRYNIQVFVTDEGGRAIQENQTYTVSRQEKFFAFTSEHGFFRQDKEGSLSVKMVNADEAPLSGSAEAEIYTAKPDNSNNIIFRYTDQLPGFKEDKKIKSFDVKFSEDAPTKVNLPPLKEGFYIIKLTAKGTKDNAGKFTFIVVNPKNSKLDLPAVTIAENKIYYPGQTASVLIGAALAKGNKYVEIYKDNYLLEQQTVTTPGTAIIDIPIKNNYSGGISITWFAAYNMKGFKGNTSLEIPFQNKDLKLNLLGAKDNLPGDKVNWTLEVKDAGGKPVDARAFVTAYDKSLNYYEPYSLSLPEVYPSADTSSTNTENSLEVTNYYPMYYDSAVMSDSIGAGSAAYSAAPEISAEDRVLRSSLSFEMPKKATNTATADKQELPPAVTIRENFAENAFWAPRLNVKNGVAPLVFTLPQRLTEWTMAAFAFTKDIKTGKTDFNFTTKQDLMIRLETPRFLREGDSFELKALITNNSSAILPVAVELITKLDDKDAKDMLGITANTAEVTIKPGEQKTLSWPIRAPQGTGMFSFTIIAKAAGLSDGEVKTFPLLPATQRLTDSTTIAVKDGSNTISLDNLSDDKNVLLKAVSLSIEPSLIMPVLNAMPLLTYGSKNTVTGLLNSYLPLAILNQLYNKYPDFKAAAANLPKRTTVLPEWNENEDMLLTELSQSPWYTLSKGYQDTGKTINLFDASLVANQKADVLKNLKNYQNKDGGFSWIKGGKSSQYITFYVLDIMAQAASFGVDIPADMTKKAINYAIKGTTLDVVSPSYENLTASLYLSYILTSFPQDWYTFDVKKLINTADEFSNYMTPLGKAYAAIICHRLGYEDKASLYINRLFDSAKQSPVTGMYWAPEERSWMWYNDSLTQHTLAIQALEIINPSDPRIKELVKWLMFNRKADQWGNSEEAAKAVYTLLNVMDRNAALTQTKVFNINWNGEESILEVKPYDTLNQNFTFSKYDEQATAQSLKAVINKKVQGSANKTSLDDFASLTAMFTSFAMPKQSPEGMLNISKQMYLVKDKKASLIKEGAQINVGDEIQVRLTINCKNSFSFVNIMDPKPAAFEADNLLSGWKYDRLSRYEEVRDNATNFFMDWLPNGTYELKYTLRPTTPGTYNVGAAVMQSMFAPEFTAHSQGFMITVK